MTKQEIAVEILKLCAQEITVQEHRENKTPDYAGRLAQAYNTIYEAISGPQDGE